MFYISKYFLLWLIIYSMFQNCQKCPINLGAIFLKIPVLREVSLYYKSNSYVQNFQNQSTFHLLLMLFQKTRCNEKVARCCIHFWTLQLHDIIIYLFQEKKHDLNHKISRYSFDQLPLFQTHSIIFIFKQIDSANFAVRGPGSFQFRLKFTDFLFVFSEKQIHGGVQLVSARLVEAENFGLTLLRKRRQSRFQVQRFLLFYR